MFVVLALAAFAANSILCRLALRGHAIDPASFTAVRLAAGALTLVLVVRATRRPSTSGGGSWPSALALFAYAAAFSFAYVTLDTGTGALLLFGSVQATMILTGVARGERPHPVQWTGLAVALAGLVYLVRPGLSAPAPRAAALMIAAGAAWGIYSLRGRGSTDPVRVTAENFARAAVPAAALLLLVRPAAWPTTRGFLLAAASGAVTSGLGYVAWYAALQRLSAVRAASVQLVVPVLTAAGGAMLLSEPITSRLVVASVTILGGVGVVIRWRERVVRTPTSR